ncbi:hypothetical protein GCM10017566_01400 [Amycolatopsis bartoniae]|uniref:Uncharacterized protein n=1 Tax=Amycolatopsis bartoniae TaxID=941986 RepID=A0A8H9M2P6_9PSEU|nr:hypothetical protein GCM10017566_01400 [Amycolatopsis bartoniae]
MPSGSRRLCKARLSGASSNQNVARTRSGLADIPNNRHIADLLYSRGFVTSYHHPDRPKPSRAAPGAEAMNRKASDRLKGWWWRKSADAT